MHIHKKPIINAILLLFITGFSMHASQEVSSDEHDRSSAYERRLNKLVQTLQDEQAKRARLDRVPAEINYNHALHQSVQEPQMQDAENKNDEAPTARPNLALLFPLPNMFIRQQHELLDAIHGGSTHISREWNAHFDLLLQAKAHHFFSRK